MSLISEAKGPTADRAYFCLRIDLDYVPWDTPDAREFGHGEPAILLRLLDLAAAEGVRCHFFMSDRALSAFPTEAEAILNSGHSLDWLCKHPLSFQERYTKALARWEPLGDRPVGFGLRGAWPDTAAGIQPPPELKFISAGPGRVPQGLRHFVVETKPDR